LSVLRLGSREEQTGWQLILLVYYVTNSLALKNETV